MDEGRKKKKKKASTNTHKLTYYSAQREGVPRRRDREERERESKDGCRE